MASAGYQRHSESSQAKISQRCPPNRPNETKAMKEKKEGNVYHSDGLINDNNYPSTSAVWVTSRNNRPSINKDSGKIKKENDNRNKYNTSNISEANPSIYRNSNNASKNSQRIHNGGNNDARQRKSIEITDNRYRNVGGPHPIQTPQDRKRIDKSISRSCYSRGYSEKRTELKQREYFKESNIRSKESKDLRSGIGTQKLYQQDYQSYTESLENRNDNNRSLEICNIGNDSDASEQMSDQDHDELNEPKHINRDDYSPRDSSSISENNYNCASESRNCSSPSSKSDDLCSSVGGKIGFDNPEGFCFLNAVVQVLRGCVRFNKDLLKYHDSSKVVDSIAEQNKILFVIKFCKMMEALKRRNDITDDLRYIQNYFVSSRRDDVNKFFINLLTILRTVSREPKERTISSDDANGKFKTFEEANHGFVFDNFYGQMEYKTTCKDCDQIVHASYQLFNSLHLLVPESSVSVPLERCFEMLFRRSEIELGDSMSCKCNSTRKDCTIQSQITHSPRYLFVYLCRESFFVGGIKRNTFITCDESISIQTLQGPVYYRLISVIDHLGTNEGGHYYCKCNYEKEDWWLLNDTQVRHMGQCGIDVILSENTIVFMFRRMKIETFN